jgi:glucosamine kinase
MAASVHLGLAGVMSPQIANQIAQALPYPNITVSDDRPTNLVGALGGQDGFLIAAGTGSFIAASRKGSTAFVGGWGYHLSDQASAAWLGRRLLEQVLLCRDGLAPHSALTLRTLAQFQDDPNTIVTFAGSAKPGDFGTLAPLLVDAMMAGDPIGTRLMQDGLAYLMSGLMTLGYQPGARLCLTGGVGAHYATLFPKEVQAGIIPPAGNALDGAIQLAAQIGAAQIGVGQSEGTA